MPSDFRSFVTSLSYRFRPIGLFRNPICMKYLYWDLIKSAMIGSSKGSLDPHSSVLSRRLSQYLPFPSLYFHFILLSRPLCLTCVGHCWSFGQFCSLWTRYCFASINLMIPADFISVLTSLVNLSYKACKILHPFKFVLRLDFCLNLKIFLFHFPLVCSPQVSHSLFFSSFRSTPTYSLLFSGLELICLALFLFLLKQPKLVD